MKKLILILIMVLAVSAQEKYLVYFQDKGITEEEFAKEPAQFFKSAENTLTKRAIERRKKVLGENYLRFADLQVHTPYIEQIKVRGIKIDNKLRWLNAVSIYAEPAQLDLISNLPFVRTIEKVKLIKFEREEFGEGKEYISDRIAAYNLDYGNSLAQSELLEIPVVHEAGFNGGDVIIGFLDSGFDWKEHPALMNLDVIYEYDYVYNDSETADEEEDVPGQDGHGTAVFSIGAGFEEGRLIGPGYGAKFLLGKTEDIASETHVEEDNFVAAVEDFERLGADIITASLGYSEFDPGEASYSYSDMNGETTLVAKVYNFAFELGVVTVAAAGNEGQSFWRHIISPADAFDVIAVGNVRINGELNPSSSRGPTADGRIKPEVTALGTNNYHATSNGSYSSSGSGTSFAAPMVAGIAGQLLSAYPHLTNEQVRDVILHAGSNFENPNNDIGYGLLSAKRALNYPNIRKAADLFQINKLFLAQNLSNNPSVKINLLSADGSWNEYPVNQSGEFYVFDLPFEIDEEETIIFFYTFQNASGVIKRDPETGSYELQAVQPGEQEPDSVPHSIKLVQNYPNPFNDVTNIRITSNRTGSGKVIIYNMLGQQIKTLYDGQIVKGFTSLTWDGTDDSGKKVSTGPYIYSVIQNNQMKSRKMILLK